MEKIPYVHNSVIHNTLAASEVVPIIIEWFNPKSVIDVGCGIGTWLSVFQQKGIEDIVGVDGDYLDQKMLNIPLSKYIAADLRKPITFQRKFDLAISLEVAEHLPETCADIFIESLIKLSDVILFSAAVPGQGGQNHLNEQWAPYWQKKFYAHGFLFYDDIRPLIWWNDKIEWWYRQNIFLVIKSTNPYYAKKSGEVLSAIHPMMHQHQITSRHNSIENLSNRILLLEAQKKRILSGKMGLFQSFKIFLKALINFVK